jgi:hypothetical protein
VPACGWTDNLQLGYKCVGALNLVPYIYIYILSINFDISGLFVIVCHRIIADY